MSDLAAEEPTCMSLDGALELLVRPRPRDLGGFSVRRALPSVERRMVGPFIFFDHIGPAELSAERKVDVRPHPHIGLATVTYLFEGELFHRDSLGSALSIRPGDVNWMIAGRGIVHSERTTVTPQRIHGIQAWVALPKASEETAPAFHHHGVASLPVFESGGATVRVIAGTAYGRTSPVAVLSPTHYVDAAMPEGATLAIDDEPEERAVYVVEGALEHAGQTFGEGDMLVLKKGAHVAVRAKKATRVVVAGGAPVDGPRHIYWNFVSSSRERIERAKDDWRAKRFSKVPGDEAEFIPLPDDA